jgi:predicted permease
LGASRSRIATQLTAEAVLLGVAGGIAGTGIGSAMFHVLAAIRPDRLARIDEGGSLWPVVAFAAVCSAAVAFVFAVVPALQSFRMDFAETLRTKGRGWLGRLNRWTGRALVIGEIALAFMLVTGGVLTSRTLSNIEHIRPGFEPRQLLVFQLPGLPAGALNEWEIRFAALPGVDAAGAVSHLPFDTTVGNWYGEYRVRSGGRSLSYTADSRAVTRGYLQAMGIRLQEGRYFGPEDRTGSPNVVIVDELLANSTWPGESALGKVIEAEHMTPNGSPFELVPSVVVGVVEHVRNHSLTQQVRAEIYSPFDQNTREGFPQTFVLRTEVPPLTLVPAVRAALRERNRNLSIDKVRAMSDYIDREISPAGFTAVLGAIFAALALLLAVTGIYGVLNYQVARAMPEMGIRMALGATARDVLMFIMRDALGMAMTGTLLGCLGAFAVAGGLRSLLYGIKPGDPLSYAVAAFALTAAALLGCWGPAWRAASANPVDTIREE